ncbi:dimethylmenaquinone methyltransferase [Clostridium carboxidivorans P7]|uniref:Putative 4-hydroxy-4-methyl-2-oxoglutarate aldolase n=1 Tax=Clostridium carboxidivorans P7 TaxID=536227 RepID=C6PS54_9CLOT|nr:4-carboxy-4-hydroxy-2-oxoadipate aldolase/oxaloacetate decarboxylase [Clostridium carboxidivorans]AKN31898.1 dimethylmenaquinone methyltransferase [Clostridium carboxidivorans P7]EET87979.1 Dimethylmenaquinone methyltransferase [Clostridium carboxidivorans P7]
MNVQLINSFIDIPTGNICDSNNREGSMDESIKPLHDKFQLTGYAMTISCIPGDNLTIHKAIEEAKPGSVLVIDCKGYTGAGVFGELFATSCIARGIKGVVIDGACRDKNDLIELNFPVFAKGVNPNGTLKETCGEINTTIQCGGRIVNPGDIIIGDCDGIVVIPQERAEEVLKKSKAKKQKEDEIKILLAQGKTTAELMGFNKKWNK